MVSKEKYDFPFKKNKITNLFKKEKKHRHTYPKLKTYAQLRNSPIRQLYKKQSAKSKQIITKLQIPFYPCYTTDKSPVCNLNKIFDSMPINKDDNVDDKKEESNYDSIISSPSDIQRSHTY